MTNRLNRSDETRAAVREALANLSDRGGLTHGTRALVNSLQLHLGCNVTQLAKMANVSTAGLGRWKKFDKGDPHRLALIRALATHEARDKEEGKVASVAAEGVDDVDNTEHTLRAVGEAFTYIPLKKIQNALGKPIRDVLTDRFGMQVLSCRISQFETDGLAVRLTLTIN